MQAADHTQVQKRKYPQEKRYKKKNAVYFACFTYNFFHYTPVE